MYVEMFFVEQEWVDSALERGSKLFILHGEYKIYQHMLGVLSCLWTKMMPYIIIICFIN